MPTPASHLQEDATKFMQQIHTIAETIPATISTITVLLVLNEPLNLHKILEDFNTPQIKIFLQEVTGDENSIYTSSKRPFNNSLVFKCKGIPTDNNTVLDKQAVKVFCNGNLHITGVKTITDALYLGDVFVTMVELMYGGTGASNMFTFSKFEVQMVNLYFQLPFPSSGSSNANKPQLLDLNKVMEHLQHHTPFFVSYNTERHAGVIIKAVEFTLLIFNSGNVIISSIKEPSQLEAVRDFIQESVVRLPTLPNTLVDKPSLLNRRYMKRPQEGFDYSKYVVLK